jgi:hypothetical protein
MLLVLALGRAGLGLVTPVWVPSVLVAAICVCHQGSVHVCLLSPSCTAVPLIACTLQVRN